MSEMAPSPSQAPMPKLPPWFKTWFSLGPDWRKILSQSRLPDEIQDIIRTVVKKSRLMRHEKVDIATDLISHFQDGANKGQSYLQIAEEFGDPTITATLIRRSKLRSRPMFMKMFRGLGMGAGMLSVAYLAMMAYFHLGSPKVSFDYLGELNKELVDLAPEQKAWNLYRPAWTKFGFSEGGGCKLFSDTFIKDGNGKLQLAKPLDEDWPVAVASLEEHAELLEVIRMGSKLPVFGLELQANPRDYSPEDFAALFPSYMNYTDTGQTEGQALMGFEFNNIGRQSTFLEWLQESTKFEVVPMNAVKQFDSSVDSKNRWNTLRES